MGLDASVSPVNADGKAELALSGVISGTYQMELAVAGMGAAKTITVIAQEAEMDGEEKKEAGSTEEETRETGGNAYT